MGYKFDDRARINSVKNAVDNASGMAQISRYDLDSRHRFTIQGLLRNLILLVLFTIPASCQNPSSRSLNPGNSSVSVDKPVIQTVASPTPTVIAAPTATSIALQPPTVTTAPRTIPTFTPTASQEVQGQFLEHLLAKQIKTASGIFIADLDGDGDQDVVVTEVYGVDFSWWRNDGGKPIIWSRQEFARDTGGVLYATVADVDGDADPDVIASSLGEMSWWRNDGNDPIIWTKILVAGDLLEASAVFASDMDGDGDMDILGTDAGADQVLWWENEGTGGRGASWSPHIIDSHFGYTQTAGAADLDGDGDIDVVAGSGVDDQIAWWQNQGGSPAAWSKQIIKAGFHWAHWVHIADIDGDDHPDVVAAAYSDNTIAWWRNGGGDPITWEPQIIDSDFPGVLTVHTADLDNDGDLDIIGTANNNSEISWWANNGGDPIQWKKTEIKAKTFGGAWGLHAGDLDGDQDIDIVGGGSSKVLWWENSTNTSAQQPVWTGGDCASAGLPGTACEGMTSNLDWTPVIREFDGIPMVLVPAGCFTMGSDTGLAEEGPAHPVCIGSPFWIDLTEVTVSQFAQFLNGGDKPAESYQGWLNIWSVFGDNIEQFVQEDGLWQEHPGMDQHPVESVTWVGARDFCAWRSARLPSEAEWEYAARGPDGWIYPWGNEFVAQNVVRHNGKPTRVGSKSQGASWVGALDMSSSLFEWTSTIYRPYPYDAEDGRELMGDIEPSDHRVFRGSAWYHPEGMHDNLTTTARFSAPPDYAAWYYGFRCVRPAMEKAQVK